MLPCGICGSRDTTLFGMGSKSSSSTGMCHVNLYRCNGCGANGQVPSDRVIGFDLDVTTKTYEERFAAPEIERRWRTGWLPRGW